jgi:hypothetical protein
MIQHNYLALILFSGTNDSGVRRAIDDGKPQRQHARSANLQDRFKREVTKQTMREVILNWFV